MVRATAALELAAQAPSVTTSSNSVMGTSVAMASGQCESQSSTRGTSASFSVDIRAEALMSQCESMLPCRWVGPVTRGLQVEEGIDCVPIVVAACAGLFEATNRQGREIDRSPCSLPNGGASADQSYAKIIASQRIPMLDGLGSFAGIRRSTSRCRALQGAPPCSRRKLTPCCARFEHL